jgi:drug/metabolite transporter (DMT)-like permease
VQICKESKSKTKMSKEKMRENKKGILSIFAFAMIGASMGIFARMLGGELALFQQVAFRLLAAVIIVAVIFNKDINYKKILKIPSRDWLVLIARSSFMYLFGVTATTVAFIQGNYGNVSFVLALPMTAILGIIILKEKINIQKGFLVFLSFVGVAVISVSDLSDILIWEQSSLFALMGTSCIALSHILRRFQTGVLNDKEIAFLMLGISTVLVFVASFIFGEEFSGINWQMSLILILIVAGLFNGLLMLTANYGFSKVSPIIANNILATQSIAGLMIGVILYQEVVSLREIVGGGLIIVSILLFNQASQKNNPA